VPTANAATNRDAIPACKTQIEGIALTAASSAGHLENPLWKV
jgi:hypothetical protein